MAESRSLSLTLQLFSNTDKFVLRLETNGLIDGEQVWKDTFHANYETKDFRRFSGNCDEQMMKMMERVRGFFEDLKDDMKESEKKEVNNGEW